MELAKEIEGGGEREKGEKERYVRRREKERRERKW